MILKRKKGFKEKGQGEAYDNVNTIIVFFLMFVFMPLNTLDAQILYNLFLKSIKVGVCFFKKNL